MDSSVSSSAFLLHALSSSPSSSSSYSSSSSSSSSAALRRFSTAPSEIRGLDQAMELITGKRKIRYLVKTRGFKVGVDNCSHNNKSDGNADDEKNNNHEAKTVPPTQLDEVIAMIVDPRSPTGGPRPEVVVRPPNVPPPKHFIKFKKHFQPVKDDVEVLPLKEVKGEADEHNWWKAVVAGVIGVG